MRKLYRHLKPVVIVILCLIFTLGLLLGRLVKNSLNSENRRFEDFSEEFFVQQVSANTLNLHYTLANPADYGITDYPVSLGTIDTDNIGEYYSSLENFQSVINSFSYKKLTPENQLTLDVLALDFETELSLGNNYLLQEMLSPSLGIQAQLPILLAEYTFRSEQDIKDYLGLLKSTNRYFQEILAFQTNKSTQSLFMSDITADRIIAQCSSFIADPENNYLTSIFEEKIQNDTTLSDSSKLDYIEQNKAAMTSYVIPAYKDLIEGLKRLKGTGVNENGLYYLSGGCEYYTYLLKSNAGLYTPVEDLQARLHQQLVSDYREVEKLLASDTSLGASSLEKSTLNSSPEQMLEELKVKLTDDFPTLPDVSYDVKYVHPDLEKFLSPAFYLTPPIDTLSPNSIYINRSSQLEGIELYTTLAHEGFPGHLYQTLYFASEDPPHIRNLFNMGGYSEGWATYVESYAYGYADTDPNVSRLLWLGRSMNLCLYSLLDIGIHYYGFTLQDTANYVKNFGITDQDVIKEIFQCVVEDPGNYLKYYMGYLSFVDIKEKVKDKQGDAFQLKQFHTDVLEIGPVQFPVLEEHLLEAS